jgi:type IV fimbrial biogenesis protein FimT
MQAERIMMQSQLRPSAGFTLIELMVTLAVAAVLLGLAVPAFNDLVRQRDMMARINDMVVAVSYARSEAIRRGARVSLQAVDASDEDNEWGAGYCVVVGAGGSCAPADPEDLLRTFEGFDDATFDGVDGLADAATVTFNGRGLPDLDDAGSIRLCSNDDTVDPGRVMNVSRTGRADVEELECNG